MRVREIIESLIGVDGNVEIEIVDDDGIAAELTGIKFSNSLGYTYGEAKIDRKLVADNERVVTA